MILASAKVADFDQFLQTFSTKGAEKRKEHGSKGSRVFRDPEDASRVSVVFDWQAEDYEKFIADPRSRQSSRRPDSRVRQSKRSPPASTTPERGRSGWVAEERRRSPRPSTAALPGRAGVLAA